MLGRRQRQVLLEAMYCVVSVHSVRAYACCVKSSSSSSTSSMLSSAQLRQHPQRYHLRNYVSIISAIICATTSTSSRLQRESSPQNGPFQGHQIIQRECLSNQIYESNPNQIYKSNPNQIYKSNPNQIYESKSNESITEYLILFIFLIYYLSHFIIIYLFL